MSTIGIPRGWLFTVLGLEILCTLLFHYYFGNYSPWWVLIIFLSGIFLAKAVYLVYINFSSKKQKKQSG